MRSDSERESEAVPRFCAQSHLLVSKSSQDGVADVNVMRTVNSYIYIQIQTANVKSTKVNSNPVLYSRSA